ncbi:MAG: hypothetical protein II404_04435 [Prevotella sp.]|nr:hypothetical protein [Prevotella sp.]
MKIKKRWIILMTAMTLIAVAGLGVGEPTFECDWSVISAADVAWLITATIFVLMMTPGLSFFYGGMVGAKNVISTMLQSFIAMGLISVLWVVIGFSLCFGDDIDVFPTHGTGGIFGTVLTGIFIQEGLIAGTWDVFVVFLYHLLAIVIVFVYTFAMSWAGYKLIDSLIPMRVSEYSEKVGLDFSQHDEHYGLAHIGERELAEYEEHIREKEKH